MLSSLYHRTLSKFKYVILLTIADLRVIVVPYFVVSPLTIHNKASARYNRKYKLIETNNAVWVQSHFAA